MSVWTARSASARRSDATAAGAATGEPQPRPVPGGPGWARLAVHVAVAGFALVTYLWRLGAADWLPDEIVYARAGRAYLQGDVTGNLEHPLLAKYLFGLGQLVAEGRLGARLPAALSGLVLCLVLYAFAREAAGWRWGLVAAAMWAALPHVLPSGALDRHAMLDVVATALAMAALYAGWRWARTGRWWPVLLAGAMLGLAAAAKLPGGLLGPVVLGAGLLGLGLSRRTLAQGAGLTGTALVAFAVTYLPAGRDALVAAAVPVTYQLQHARDGHTVLLAGRLYDDAPWWAHLHYAVRDDGVALTAGLLLLAAAAVLWFADRRLTGYLLGAAVLPLAVLSTSSVALPHYRFLWLPPVVLLAALGLRALTARGPVGRAAAAALCLLLAVPAAEHLRAVLTQAPGGYGRTACAARALGVADGVAVVRGYPDLLAADLPALTGTTALDPARPPDLVVLDPRSTSRFPVPEIEAEVGSGRYHGFAAGQLQVHVRAGLADDAAGRAALAGCGLSPLAR